VPVQRAKRRFRDHKRAYIRMSKTIYNTRSLARTHARAEGWHTRGHTGTLLGGGGQCRPQRGPVRAGPDFPGLPGRRRRAQGDEAAVRVTKLAAAAGERGGGVTRCEGGGSVWRGAATRGGDETRRGG
jgi:hypothetical protein